MGDFSLLLSIFYLSIRCTFVCKLVAGVILKQNLLF